MFQKIICDFSNHIVVNNFSETKSYGKLCREKIVVEENWPKKIYFQKNSNFIHEVFKAVQSRPINRYAFFGDF